MNDWRGWLLYQAILGWVHTDWVNGRSGKGAATRGEKKERGLLAH